MQKAEQKPPEKQEVQQAPQQVQISPFNALQIMTNALVNANRHAMMIQQVTGAKIDPIKDNLVTVANHIDLLYNWMTKELKMSPQQPMNRTQKRRAERQSKKKKVL